jgi:hypothetical protein
LFARVKESRQREYLQIVENYREEGKIRQRVVLYIGHYASIEVALQRMPQDRRALRSTATRTGKEHLRREADALDERLAALQQLVDDHPDLIERDRQRVKRHRRRQAERRRVRRESRGSRF